MAVAFDAKMSGGNSSDGLNQQAANVTSISSTGMTVGASATLLVAMAVWGLGSGTQPSNLAMTWNGVSMTSRATVGSQVSGAYALVAVFTLVNPATGNRTLAASWTTASDCYLSCVSFTGTDTVTGVDVSHNVTATQTTTLTVTSTTDGATVAVFGVDGAPPTTNFTKIFATAPLNPGGGGSYTLGGTSNGHTFTGAGGTRQALAGVHVIAGGAAPVPPRILPVIVSQAVERAALL